ncbi:hypothetical protein Tco_0351418 [Tanacetum coccineum]
MRVLPQKDYLLNNHHPPLLPLVKSHIESSTTPLPDSILLKRVREVESKRENPSVQRDLVCCKGLKITIDQMETYDAQIEGTDEQIGGADDQVESTEEKNEGTKEIFESTEEKVESTAGQIEDVDIPQAVKKFNSLTSDEELARKVQRDWEAEEVEMFALKKTATNEALLKYFDDIKARIKADRILAEEASRARKREHVGNFKNIRSMKSLKFEDIQAMYEKIKRSTEDFIAIGSVEDESLIKKKEKERFLQRRRDKDRESNRRSQARAQDEDKEVDYEVLDKKYPSLTGVLRIWHKPQFDESKRLRRDNLNVVN